MNPSCKDAPSVQTAQPYLERYPRTLQTAQPYRSSKGPGLQTSTPQTAEQVAVQVGRACHSHVRASPWTERRPAVWFADELEAASRLPGYQLCLQEASHLRSGHSCTRKVEEREKKLTHALARSLALTLTLTLTITLTLTLTLARAAGGRRALRPFGLVPRRAQPRVLGGHLAKLPRASRAAGDLAAAQVRVRVRGRLR